MDFINANLLTLIVFAPLVCAAIIMLTPRSASDKSIRWLSFGLSLIPAALSIYLWAVYPAAVAANPAQQFQFMVDVPWFAQINSRYILGVDGISV